MGSTVFLRLVLSQTNRYIILKKAVTQKDRLPFFDLDDIMTRNPTIFFFWQQAKKYGTIATGLPARRAGGPRGPERSEGYRREAATRMPQASGNALA